MPQLAPRLLLAAALSTGLAVAVAAGAPSGAATVGAATYANHPAPTKLGADAGEPSIGVNWKSGATFLQAGLNTVKAEFDAAGQVTWSDASGTTTSLISLDPVAVSDNRTGRWFVSQLAVVGSLMEYSDDNGKTWSPSQGSGAPAGADHQTLGVGPYPKEGLAQPLTAYPNAVYYCSQEIGTALCARSDNGGQTFGGGIPTYSLADCNGLHGHVRVALDGTVYLPNKNCNSQAALVVSEDAGTTWSVRRIPGSSNGSSDPSVASGRDGTTYAAYTAKNGTVSAVATTDRGRTFSKPVDLGAQVGVVNAAFPATIAGDGTRAAVAFLGTKTEGNAQNQYFGQNSEHTAYEAATWHLYVATTLDRGQTWKTVDLTPKDPVQRGRICQGGTGCSGGDRNLLDFMDIQVDATGRVLVGWPDGCTGACVTSNLVATNTHTSLGTISRQSSGPLLFATPQKP